MVAALFLPLLFITDTQKPNRERERETKQHRREKRENDETKKTRKNLKTIFQSFARSELCLTHFDKMWTKTGELCVEVSKNYNAQATG